MAKQMGKTKVRIEARTLNLNATKVELKMIMVPCVLNVIQHHPIVQIIEQQSFDFHQSHNETLTCPNQSNQCGDQNFEINFQYKNCKHVCKKNENNGSTKYKSIYRPVTIRCKCNYNKEQSTT